MPKETAAALPKGRPRIPGEIWVLVAAAFVIAIGFGLISPVLPSLAQSFGVGAFASSVVVSVFAFFRLVFAPASGSLIARLGERPVYLAGLVIVAVSTGATAFAQDYWQLVLFRGLGGIGSTMFTVSAVALLVRLAPAGIRARVSSAYASAFLLGGVGGPVIGGLLGGLGLRVPFLVYSVALLIAAGIVAVFLRRASLRPAPGRPALPSMSVREAWSDSAYRASVGSAFANGWANFGMRNAILPLFATAVVGKEPWVAGMALAVFAAGNAAGLALAGRRADRIGRKPFILSGLIISGVATAATGLAQDLTMLVIVSVVAGIGAGALNPAQQASLADVIGRERNGGPALAAFQMSQDLGSIVGPLIAGLLVDQGSYPLAFGVTGAITLLAAVPWLRARETHSTQPHPERA
ncbi:MAG: MFS transporter [Propionicimonas sp.]